MSHRPENDSILAERVIQVQQLALSLDRVIRERGVVGLANELSKLTAATREAEWRCNSIIRENGRH